MNVKELIQKLKQFPDNWEIYVNERECYEEMMPLEEVKVVPRKDDDGRDYSAIFLGW